MTDLQGGKRFGQLKERQEQELSGVGAQFADVRVVVSRISLL